MKAVVHSIEQDAAKYYDQRLPYHNFSHALTAAAAGQKICRRCRKQGLPIDPQVVYVALLFHDAGYHLDHAAKGFTTKEAYSADLAARYLHGHGYDTGFVDQVTHAILCTHKDAVPQTNEDKAVRAADIANVGGAYPAFLASTRLLHREMQQLSGHPVGWEDYKRLSRQILDCYLNDDLLLTTEDAGFVLRGRSNLQRLSLEPAA